MKGEMPLLLCVEVLLDGVNINLDLGVMCYCVFPQCLVYYEFIAYALSVVSLIVKLGI